MKRFDVTMVEKARVVARSPVEERKQEEEQSGLMCSNITDGKSDFSIRLVSNKVELHS